MLRYAITNRSAADGDRGKLELLEQVRRLSGQGLEYLQLRERGVGVGAAPGVGTKELLELARAIVLARDEGIMGSYGGRMRVLVHTSAAVAREAGADGVHLPGAWLGEGFEDRLGAARRELGAGLVSVSCHSVAEVRQAAAAGVDLVLFGPVFGKVVDGVAVRDGVGLEQLREACAAAGGRAVLALGGVTEDNMAACVEAGRQGLRGYGSSGPRPAGVGGGPDPPAEADVRK